MAKKTRLAFAVVFIVNLVCVKAFSQEGLSISIVDAAAKLNAQLVYEPLSKTVMLTKNNHSLQFRADEKIMLVDYKSIVEIEPPQIIRGTVYVSSSLINIANDIFTVKNPVGHYKIGAILIDPGHGGKDAGAIGKHTINKKKVEFYEKDINLRTSQMLYDKLKAKYPDKFIKMTRTSDIYLSLEQRVEIADSIPLEDEEAILYISIHVNSAFDKKATGFEVWYLSQGYRRKLLDEDDVGGEEHLLPILNSMLEEEFTNESIMIAKFILDGMDAQVSGQSPNRGMKEEEWFVVRNANMPSVLVELGFISNKEEAQLLNDNKYLDKLATGIYNGLVSFITLFEKSVAPGGMAE